jgi:hypothetical protein
VGNLLLNSIRYNLRTIGGAMFIWRLPPMKPIYYVG